MIPNALFEMLFIRGWMIYQEFQFRDIRENPRWFKYLMAVFPMFADLAAYYTTLHPETFSHYAQVGMKMAGTATIMLSRLPIFKTGIFSTLASEAIFDFCMGIAIISRYFIFKCLGISLANYAPGEFRIVPVVFLMVLLCVIQVTIIPWLMRFRRAMNYPGMVLKVMTVFYWAPSVLVLRPMDVIDISDGTIIIMSSITSLTVVCFGWLYLIGYRRQIQMENHYLAMQTELFAEHAQILKEQADFVKMCQGYLENFDINVPKLNFPEEEMPKHFGYSTNELLDTAIANKAAQGIRKGIPVSVEMENLELPGEIPEIHFLTIFYNLFDNALEAAAQCDASYRYVKVNAYTNAQGLYFSIENSARPGRRLGERLATTKADEQNHGLGLKIVRDIVRKGHGKIHLNNEKNKFTAEIFLPEK